MGAGPDRLYVDNLYSGVYAVPFTYQRLQTVLVRPNRYNTSDLKFATFAKSRSGKEYFRSAPQFRCFELHNCFPFHPAHGGHNIVIHPLQQFSDCG